MKGWVKQFLRRVGFRVLRESSLPRCLDPLVDLREIDKSRAINSIVDVGANVGQSVRLFRREFPDALIVSCEPSPEAFEQLQELSSEKVLCENLALGSTIGTASFQRDSPLSQLGHIVSSTNAAALTVNVETLDNLAGRHSLSHIDLLKIDVEGYEMEVLKGATELLASDSIRAILIECCFDRNDSQHTHFLDIFSLLEVYGFKFLGLYEVHHRLSQIHYCNALFIHSAKK